MWSNSLRDKLEFYTPRNDKNQEAKVEAELGSMLFRKVWWSIRSVSSQHGVESFNQGLGIGVTDLVSKAMETDVPHLCSTDGG